MADADKFLTNYHGSWDLVFCLWPRNKATEFWIGWWNTPSAEGTEIPKVPYQEQVDKLFDSQGVVHKEFVPERKTVNAEFFEGVMDRLLKRIQRVRPAAFCSRDFFFLHPPTKLQVFTNFWPKQCYNALSLPSPVLSRFISARLFSVPQVENEDKRTPLCGCCWDQRSRNRWIKEGPKREIFSSFQKLYDGAKGCIYASGAYFE